MYVLDEVHSYFVEWKEAELRLRVLSDVHSSAKNDGRERSAAAWGGCDSCTVMRGS